MKTTSFTKEYQINASISKVWEALTNPKIIRKWSGSEAIMDEKEGFNFKLWNGDIYGKNLEVVENEFLKQEWFGGEWNEPSIVSIILKQSGDSTLVLLEHTNVPENELTDFSEGWDLYYFGAIAELLEN